MAPPRRAASSATRFLDPVTVDVGGGGQLDRVLVVNVEEGVDAGEQLRADLFTGSFNEMKRHSAASTAAQDSLFFPYLGHLPCRVQTHPIDEREGSFFPFTAGDCSELCHARCPRLRRI